MERGEHTVIGLDGSPESVLLGAKYREAGPFPRDSASGPQQVGWEDGDPTAAFCQEAVGLHFLFVSVRGGKGKEDVEEMAKLLQNLRSG